MKIDAVDEDVFAVANAIAGVKAFPLVDVFKEDKYSLTQES